MSDRLPSLGALRAFEAAARHLSLTRAAEELHVTPAAISHQVKTLEDDLGLRLFDRTGRRLALTPEARAGLAEPACDPTRILSKSVSLTLASIQTSSSA